MLISLFLNFKKNYPIDWLLTLFFAILATSAIRNFPLFVFGTFIIFSKNLSLITEKVISRKKKSPKLLLIKNLILICILILFILQIKQIAQAKQIGFGLEKGASKAVDFYFKNDLQGPIFNNFDIGSYLEYRLYPKEKVFVDGRPEAYPASFFQKDYKNNNKIITMFQFNVIFFTHTDQTPWANMFLRQIVNNKDWKLIYLDDYAIILAKNNNMNNFLIKKFAINQLDLQVKNYEENDFNSLLRLAIFFNKIGWTDQEIMFYEKILSLKPTYCPVLYNLSLELTKQQSPIANIYINRFNSGCK